jgi:hypothetical protein
VVGAARAAVDLLAMLGGATLAVSAVVLGASMFPPDDAVRQACVRMCLVSAWSCGLATDA